MSDTNKQIAIYQTDDGSVHLDVQVERDTVWLCQNQMGELFGRERSVITRHLRNIFAEGELEKKSNVQNLHIANSQQCHRVSVFHRADGGNPPGFPEVCLFPQKSGGANP